MTKKITMAIIIFTAVLWIGWDVYVATNNVVGDTESEVIWNWGIAKNHLGLPLGLGALLGHWISERSKNIKLLYSVLLVLTLGALAEIAGMFLRVPYGGLGAASIGFFTGYFFWSQGK